jgi:hypothetical protein
VAIAAVLIVFVGLRILTPQTVAFDDVRAGDRLFIRTAADQQLVAAGRFMDHRAPGPGPSGSEPTAGGS